jgi:hypothetical protein
VSEQRTDGERPPSGTGSDRSERDEEEVDTSHLDDVEDGCGCAEVWDHLSEQREE